MAFSRVNLSSAEASVESVNEAVIGNSADATMALTLTMLKKLKILGLRQYTV